MILRTGFLCRSGYEFAQHKAIGLRSGISEAEVEALKQGPATGEWSELELHVKYLGATGQDDPETPYKNIVAMGEHAATLHLEGEGLSDGVVEERLDCREVAERTRW